MSDALQQQLVPAERELPNKLTILPIQGKPLFPGVFTPMVVQSKPELRVVEAALGLGAGFLGLALTLEPDSEGLAADDLFRVGVAARIVRRINLPDGGLNIFISVLKRFRLVKVLDPGPPLIGAVQYLEELSTDSDEVRALTRALLSEMKQVSQDNPLFSEETRLNMVNIDQPGKIADFVTSILNIDRGDQQNILETLDVGERMEKVLVFIKKEQELLKIQRRIQTELSERVEKSQREYFLKEQLKAIRQELGMAVDSKSEEYERLRNAIGKLELSGEVKERVEDELEKFALMDPNAAEFVVTRNYLETVTSLPWLDPPPQSVDLAKAEKVLNADHFGLDEVKERILEYLAVRKLNPRSRGSIICLVGPPGVGKTSIGRSVARSMGRAFFRFSVGGMRDEAEIKGHRRTYVGAMPGKIIQGLRIVKTKNPVFMIDEIDKLGVSYQGDPSSALLEVLDPEQNISFRDHYLDLPFDISQVLFIATANTTDSIPGPLLDRMELIRLSGYIDSEKMEIARTYLIPKSLKRSGLTGKQVRYQKTALREIARSWAREAGVRNYEKALDKIHRKVARQTLTGSVELPLHITTENLADYLGKPVFLEEERNKLTRPGMATGLAWTPMGGAVLTIETLAITGEGTFKITGQLGEVMQESASIAYSYSCAQATSLGVSRDFFDSHRIHIHVPAGATPKDGPSAGITLATALLSLAMNRKVRNTLAMTGELSLVGNVLPIGGLKEKVVAAKRNRIKEVVFPAANEPDLAEIPDHVRRGMTFTPVRTMDDVLERIF